MNEKLTPERIEEAKGYIKQVLELDYWIAESRKAHNIELNIGGLEEKIFAHETSLAAIEAVDAIRELAESFVDFADNKDDYLRGVGEAYSDVLSELGGKRDDEN